MVADLLLVGVAFPSVGVVLECGISRHERETRLDGRVTDVYGIEP